MVTQACNTEVCTYDGKTKTAHGDCFHNYGECYSKADGSDYRGSISVTEGGLQCQVCGGGGHLDAISVSPSQFINLFIFIFAIFIQTCHVLICGRCGRTSSLTSTTRHTQTTPIAGLAVTTRAATRTGSHARGATR